MSIRDLWRKRPEDRSRFLDVDRPPVDETFGEGLLRGAATLAVVGVGAYGAARFLAPKSLSRIRSSAAAWWRETAASARGRLNPNLLTDLETAKEIFSAGRGYIGGKDVALAALMERYGGNNVLQAVAENKIPDVVKAFVQMPTVRQTAGRMGVPLSMLARQLGAAAIYGDAPTLGSMIRGAARTIRFPFTNWRPFELLIPTEMVGPKPVLGLINKQLLPDLPDVSGGFFAAGSLFSITESAGTHFISSKPSMTGMSLGRTSSGMGAGAAARMGLTAARPLGEILDENPELGKLLRSDESMWSILRNRSMTLEQRLNRFFLEVGERYGVGPQYAAQGYQIGGRPASMLRALRNIVLGVRKEPLATPKASLGRTPEGRLFWGILRDLGLSKSGPVAGIDDLSRIERIKMRLGVEPQRLMEEVRRGRTYYKHAKVAQFLDKAGSPLNKEVLASKSAAMMGDFYVWKGKAQGVKDWANYHLNRPTWLLQELTGLGLKPGRGPMESLWRLGTRVAMPAYLGWQALQYAEYKSRKYFGYGPISGPARVYAHGRVAAQQMLDATGISGIAEEIEDQFPGAMESPFSKAAGLVAGPVAGAAIGRRISAPKGGAIGLAAGLVAGLTFAGGITTPAKNLREIYEGEREVPVRADRWWVLGRQPWGGSRIKYWKKHWLAEMMTDYRDKAIWGSKKESWRKSLLPVPENWFLLKNVVDPYYVENLHYYDRPYPTTSPMFENVPLVGPAMAGTIGRLLKPIRYRNIAPPGNRGLPEDVLAGQGYAMGLGMEPLDIQQPIPKTKWTMAQLTGETIHRLFDWTGLPGFMAGAIKESITGRAGWMEGETLLAASGDINSAERAYYEKNYGGMLGMTEFFRRFIPKKRRNAFYNPIDNLSPGWLPGSRSVYPGDRKGYIDFHQGDPYCVSADTLVEVGFRLVRADAIAQGDYVRTAANNLKHVRAVAKRPVRNGEKCFRITIQGLTAFPSTYSEEHPLLKQIHNGPGKKPTYEMTQAQFLCVGDHVALPLPSIEQDVVVDLANHSHMGSTLNWVYTHKDEESAEIYEYLLERGNTPFDRGELSDLLEETGWSRRKFEAQQASIREGKSNDKVRRFVKVTDDVGYLIGIYAAEGSVGRGYVSFALHAREDNIRGRIDRACSNVFNKPGLWRGAEGTNGGDHIVCSTLASEVLPALCSSGAPDKSLPKWAFILDRQRTLQVVKGVIDGDGSCFESDGRFRVSLKTVSRHLAYQVWLLLAKLGYRSTVSSHTPSDDDIAVLTYYNVNVNGDRGRRLAEELGYVEYSPEEGRQPYPIFRDGYIILRIAEITEVVEDFVFGFQVEDDKTFCVPGVATHNTKLEKGEARLPGPGYEALQGLHSGKPGIYDEFDRFKILADVAPFSDAFKQHKAAIQHKVQSGAMSRSDTERFYRTLDNMQERLESRVSSTGLRYGSGAFATGRVTLERMLGPTTFQVSEMPGVTFKMAGVKDPRPGMDGTMLGAHDRLRSQMSARVGQQIQMTWGGAGVETPAIVDGLNQEAIRAGIGQDRLTGLGYQAKYGRGGLKAAWESIAHMQLPAFMDYPRVKMLGTRSAVEEYEQFQAYGTANTNWASPFKNYILPWWHSTVRSTPAETIRARQITEYMDKLKYHRASMYAQQAERVRDTRMAQEFTQQANRTLVGLRTNSPDFFKNVYSALPPAERPYFNVFAGTTSEEEQERIIQAVPEYMRHIYVGAWKRKMPGGEFDSPVLQRYAEYTRRAVRSPDDEVAEFFGQNAMPDNDWMGWHPAVDFEAITIRTANREGVDIHHMGMWENQEIAAKSRFPDLEPPPVDTGLDLGIRDGLMMEMAKRKFQDVRSFIFPEDENSHLRLRLKRRRKDQMREIQSRFNASSYYGWDW